MGCRRVGGRSRPRRASVVVGDLEAWIRGAGTLDEQADRLVFGRPVPSAWRLRQSGSDSERTGYSRSPATPSGSRLVARMRRPGHARSSALASLRTGVDQVLAVVQDEQHLAAAEVARAPIRSHRRPIPRRCPASRPPAAERVPRRSAPRARRATRRRRRFRAALPRPGGARRVLPTPPGPGQRDQRRLGRSAGGPPPRPLGGRRNVLRWRGRLFGSVVSDLQRREGARQALRLELVEVLGLGQVLQPVLAQVDKRPCRPAGRC